MRFYVILKFSEAALGSRLADPKGKTRQRARSKMGAGLLGHFKPLANLRFLKSMSR